MRPAAKLSQPDRRRPAEGRRSRSKPRAPRWRRSPRNSKRSIPTRIAIRAPTSSARARSIVGDIRPVLLVLLGGAALLLVIACVNVVEPAARSLREPAGGRSRSVARSAHRSGRLDRQFVTEALVLVRVGCALGLASAHWAMRAAVGLIPRGHDGDHALPE